MHLTTLIPFVPLLLTTALPTTESSPSPFDHTPNLAISNPSTLANDPTLHTLAATFTIPHFAAWLTSSPSPTRRNWSSFDVRTSDAQSYTCYFETPQDVLSATASWPCAKHVGGRKDGMWFRFTPGFGEVELQRRREAGGSYMTEYATQGTYWDFGQGGNATVTELDGVTYEKKEPWAFEVTRISG